MTTQATAGRLESVSSYIDPYPGRKGRERIVETCGRCGGTGVYNAPSRVTFYTSAVNDITTGCFSCAGTGVRSFLVSSARQTARRRAKEADRSRGIAAQIAYAREAFMARHGAVYESLAEQHAQLRHNDPPAVASAYRWNRPKNHTRARPTSTIGGQQLRRSLRRSPSARKQNAQSRPAASKSRLRFSPRSG